MIDLPILWRKSIFSEQNSGYSMSDKDQEQFRSVFKKDLTKFFLEAKVSPDNLKLFIDVTPHLTPVVDRKEILNPLLEVFPNIQPDTAVIDEICHLCGAGKPILHRRIQRGTEPVDGLNGNLLLLVKGYSGAGQPGEDAEGKFSFANMHLFDNVQVGQIVARVYPPKEGKDGVDALGKPIKAKPGVPVKVTIDKTLELAKGSGLQNEAQVFDRIIAKADGLLTNQSGSLSIKDTLDIKGDVDYHCGNIDFIGKVAIAGDVLPGFRVAARQGILVRGNVQKASLSSKQGDIDVKGYVIGCPDTYISCAGDFSAKLAQAGHIIAHGKISIAKEAVNCVLRTHTCVMMPSGRLVGGHAYVVLGVQAKEIGNDAGQHTVIEFASAVETDIEFTRLRQRIEEHRKPLQLIEMHLGPFLAMPYKIKHLKGDFRIKIEALYAKMEEIRNSLKALEEQRNAIMAAAVVNPDCRANARDRLHAGSVITYRSVLQEFKNAVAGPVSVVYNAEKQEFATEALKEINCPDNQSKKGQSQNKGKKT
jgi:uncharacterized protein (DUF342 family)